MSTTPEEDADHVMVIVHRILDALAPGPGVTPGVALNALCLIAQGVMANVPPGQREGMARVFISGLQHCLTRPDTQGTA